MRDTLPSACSSWPASNCLSGWGHARCPAVLPPSTQREKQMWQKRRREARWKESNFPSLPFLQSVLNEGKNQSRSPCSSYTSSLFPFVRWLSHVTPPWTLVKQCHIYFFSPQFRHHLLTSPTARSPCFRFPSSYNYPFFPCHILKRWRGATPFSSYMPKADIFQKPLWLCTHIIMTSPEWFFWLHVVWGHAVLNVIFSVCSSHSQEHIQRKLVHGRWYQKKS